MATMAPAASALVSEFPEVVNAARIDRPRSASVKYNDILIQEERIGYADNSIFQIFTIPFIQGDPNSALESPYSVVITEDMARKYFGEEDPLGKILKINGDTEFTVTGVIESIPKNSHLIFNMLLSFETFYAEKEEGLENWFNIQFLTYLLLDKESDYKELEEKLPVLVDKYLGPTLQAMGGRLEFFLQPLTSIHLHSHLGNEVSINGDITYVYLFSGIAIFVLLIACVNFINLSTARSAARSTEVGIRKTFGATRKNLIRQFLGESIVFSLLSVLLAMILLELSIPFFNSITGREISLHYLRTPWLIPAYLGFASLVGLVAGSYPAFFLSSFQPVDVIKGERDAGPAKSSLRRILVVTQFTISITLIIGTLTVYSQLNYMKNKDLGFNKENVIVIPRINDAVRRSYRSIRNELLNIPGVVDVSASSIVPSRGNLVGIFQPEGFSEKQVQQMDYVDVDYNYLSMMEMEIVEGRDFSVDLATDSTESVIINETAARKFGWAHPVGKTFLFSSPPGNNHHERDRCRE
jgi:putative ABC transport system permease protein